ncbi:MAG TPA: chemotaxis protein CheW [Verrucomicrobiae bacterium]|nr:chemotaxis protein CheW [Verrucomicrobiae bacterium]
MEPRESNSPSPAAQASPPNTVAPAGTPEAADCWNKIGVAGDSSCEHLPGVGHCRNCAVYAGAGAQLLDRELPANYRREWTEHVSREKIHSTPGKNSVVIFRVGHEWLALPTRNFQEVAERRRVHSLPHRRHGIVLGLINVRGELLLCVALGRLLGIERTNEKIHSIQHRLVIAEWQGTILTFPVDEIHGIHRYHAEELKPPPVMVARANPGFATGLLAWRDKWVGCLDAELLFSTLNRSLA